LFETVITTYKGNKNKLRWPNQNQQDIKVKLKGKKNNKNHSIKRRKKLEDRIFCFLKGEDMNSEVGGKTLTFLV